MSIYVLSVRLLILDILMAPTVILLMGIMIMELLWQFHVLPIAPIVSIAQYVTIVALILH